MFQDLVGKKEIPHIDITSDVLHSTSSETITLHAEIHSSEDDNSASHSPAKTMGTSTENSPDVVEKSQSVDRLSSDGTCVTEPKQRDYLDNKRTEISTNMAENSFDVMEIPQNIVEPSSECKSQAKESYHEGKNPNSKGTAGCDAKCLKNSMLAMEKSEYVCEPDRAERQEISEETCECDEMTIPKVENSSDMEKYPHNNSAVHNTTNLSPTLLLSRFMMREITTTKSSLHSKTVLPYTANNEVLNTVSESTKTDSRVVEENNR